MSTFEHKTDAEILETLLEHAPVHVTDLAMATDTHAITVDQTCSRLYQQGLIYPLGRGCYKVTDAGRRLVETECDL
ncbi:transcription regulator [Haladaptatus paucihalophilus DX253]|uniref:Transcription regulator n=2 Tax=Halobacteriales TaxID=2235 RepID=E7QT13_HALPU|nr:transcription regulator [Haladaptatus paucihalophilus DX253]ELZ28674.1 hypothetical protein C474_14299 [Halogeometricum pallidum JCM 14848]SHL62927.1 hypothetical protein SAMN05444342_4303 [Haladaptatus paucihalophilus DX253]